MCFYCFYYNVIYQHKTDQCNKYTGIQLSIHTLYSLIEDDKEFQT